ncbi:hypothetical protein JCM11491_004494 [Sporobolomyces phaffii]
MHPAPLVLRSRAALSHSHSRSLARVRAGPPSVPRPGEHNSARGHPTLRLTASSSSSVPPPRPRLAQAPHLALAGADPTDRASYSHLFQTRTRWIAHTLANGTPLPRTVLYKVLAHRRVSPDSVANWVDVLHRRDPIYALEQLGLLESAVHPDAPDASAADADAAKTCPDWLYLAIPAMVSELDHAPYLASQLVSDRFRRLDEPARGVFVARCVEHFLKVRHYVALRETVEFVALSPDRPISSEASFGRVLAALASDRRRATQRSSAPAALLHALRDDLVATMTQDSLPKVDRTRSLATWLPLFTPALIPPRPDDAIALAVEMTRAGWPPRRKVLHQVLRVVVRDRGRTTTAAAREDAAKRIWDELERAHEGKPPGPWLRTRLAAAGTRADEVPLHLRAERTGRTARNDDDEGQDSRPSSSNAGQDPTRVATAAQPAGPILLAARTEEDCSPSNAPPLTPADPTSRGPAVPRGRRASARRAARRAMPRDDIYATTALSDRTSSLAYFRQLDEFVSVSGRGTSFPAPPFASSAVAWAALFQSIVDEPTAVPTRLVLAVVRKLELASSRTATAIDERSQCYVPPAPTLRLYTIVMRCLFARGAPDRVVAVFQKLEAKGFALDATVIDLYVRALCHLGRAHEAVRAVKWYEHVPGVHDPALRTSVRSRPRPQQSGTRAHSVRLDVVPFNSLLAHYTRAGEYARVWARFKDLVAGKHAVRPDVATVTILVDAARYASVEAGRGWDGLGLGLGLGLGRLEQVDASFATRHHHDHHRRPGGGGGGVVDDKWDRVAAARRVESLVWDEIVELNWQDLDVANPLEPRRWWSSSTTRRDEWRPFVSTLSPRRLVYPDVYPSDAFVRAVVVLVGVHSHVVRIGRILAFARWARVDVSRQTLCVALLFVEGDAAVSRARVAALRRWIADWVGETNVPTEDEIAWMRRGGTVQGKPELR